MKVGFGSCVLDSETRELRKDGCAVHLTPLAFRLLELLLEQRPRALSKAELQDALWPGTFVTEASLSSLVADLRSAIGDTARGPTLIRTVHRFGYAFAGAASVLTDSQPMSGPRPVYRLFWKNREVVLDDGETIVGRAADATFVIDDASVSRRHIRVAVADNVVTLQDLGSKNGTTVNGRRVSGEGVRLEDGDAIRIGSVPVTFRAYAEPASTETQGAGR
jgi:DNA-binding winged helix-turn-helix (wHTH) protein